MDQWESGLGSDPSGTCSPVVLRLRVEESTGTTRTIVARRFPIVLGRLSQADVPVDDPWTSAVHCLLDLHGGQIHVRDLETRRGTTLNGLAIFRQRLRAGDVLEVGTTRLIVESIAHQDGTRAAFKDTDSATPELPE
jgi:pSer/pThr/pTyr-binding forkhead associated (FHA) protein